MDCWWVEDMHCIFNQTVMEVSALSWKGGAKKKKIGGIARAVKSSEEQVKKLCQMQRFSVVCGYNYNF